MYFIFLKFIGWGYNAEEREKSLARILTFDISEKEQEWLDYTKEETQIKLGKEDLIYYFRFKRYDSWFTNRWGYWDWIWKQRYSKLFLIMQHHLYIIV